MVMLAFNEYKRAEAESLVTQGIYRVSRNPQWVGLVLVFVGTALAVAAWLIIVLLAVLIMAYHFQILLEEKICLAEYGREYEAYMK